MILQLDKNQLSNHNINNYNSIKCINCGDSFFKKKNVIINQYNRHLTNIPKFCSLSCLIENIISKIKNKIIRVKCAIFNLLIVKKETRKKIIKRKLILSVIKEIHKSYPNLNITHTPENGCDIKFDIYIPKLKLAFMFKNVYNITDYKIRPQISAQINICNSCEIMVYFFDSKDIKCINYKECKKYSIEIIEKIQRHESILQYNSTLKTLTK